MSIGDYAARFSLELVLITVAAFGLWANFSLTHHAPDNQSDQSVMFSFLKSHASLNRKLVLAADTTTIYSISQHPVSGQTAFGIVLAAQSMNTASRVITASTMQDGVIVKTNPSDTQGVLRDGFTTYKVQPGDTITNIASSFGVSPETIMMENKLNQNSTIKAGQELTILPTTGLSYTVTESDTLESILKKYKVSEDDFLDANNLESFEDLAIGTEVVIPQNVVMPVPKPASRFVKDESNKVVLKTATAPANLVNSLVSFIWPTPVRTITQGFSRRHLGLDISNSKMEPIYAASDGFVEVSGYQTNGYGNTIVINHGNGFKTRYGHISQLYVSAGDFVSRGQTIAKQGRTGRVRGATGIHLHFEIMKNGTRVNPLSYVHP